MKNLKPKIKKKERNEEPVKRWIERSLDLPTATENSFLKICPDNQKSILKDHLDQNLKFSSMTESAFSTTELLSKQNQHLINYPKYFLKF